MNRIRQSLKGCLVLFLYISKSKTFETYQHLFSLLQQSSSLSDEAMSKALAYQFFYYLVTEYSVTSESQHKDYNLKFNLAVNYFEHNFMDKNCSINTVCNNLNISRSYLYTLFIKKLIFPHDLF